jgi:xanthine permease XanP
MLIIATSFGVGLGIAAVPELLHLMPKLVQNLFDSAITSGGITALVLCLVLPEPKSQSSDAAVALELEEHGIKTKV